MRRCANGIADHAAKRLRQMIMMIIMMAEPMMSGIISGAGAPAHHLLTGGCRLGDGEEKGNDDESIVASRAEHVSGNSSRSKGSELSNSVSASIRSDSLPTSK